MQHVSNLAELQQAVTANKTVVIKIGATWCAPCRKVQPLYEAEAKTAAWKGLVYDIEKTTDRAHDAIMQACNVGKIPHFAVFVDGTLKATKQTSNIDDINLLVAEATQPGAR